jgi:hypothetical protein
MLPRAGSIMSIGACAADAEHRAVNSVLGRRFRSQSPRFGGDQATLGGSGSSLSACSTAYGAYGSRSRRVLLPAIDSPIQSHALHARQQSVCKTDERFLKAKWVVVTARHESESKIKRVDHRWLASNPSQGGA